MNATAYSSINYGELINCNKYCSFNYSKLCIVVWKSL